MSTKRPPKANEVVQKQLLRGTQKSTKQQATVKTHTSPSFYQQKDIKKVTVPLTSTSSQNKYRVPQLQTTEGLANHIDQFKAKTGPKYNDVCDLTPRSKAIVTERVMFYIFKVTQNNKLTSTFIRSLIS